jgi:hypothetical protein
MLGYQLDPVEIRLTPETDDERTLTSLFYNAAHLGHVIKIDTAPNDERSFDIKTYANKRQSCRDNLKRHSPDEPWVCDECATGDSDVCDACAHNRIVIEKLQRTVALEQTQVNARDAIVLDLKMEFARVKSDLDQARAELDDANAEIARLCEEAPPKKRRKGR